MILIVAIYVVAKLRVTFCVPICFSLGGGGGKLPNLPVYPCNYCNYFVVAIAPIFAIIIAIHNSYYFNF